MPSSAESDAGGAGCAPGRDEQLVGLDAGSVVELEHQPARARDAHHRRLQPHVHAASAQRLEHLRTRERLVAGEQSVAAMDERHVRAESGPGLGHLDADDASAEDREPPGDLARRGRLSIGPRPRVAQSGDVRHASPRPRGDHDRLARDERLVSDHDASLAVDPPVTADQRHVVLLEPGELGRVVEVVARLVPPGEHGSDVDRTDREARHAAHLMRQVDRPQQRLRRHAGVERALAADELLLDEGDRDAVLSEPSRRHLARGAGAQHHHIELAHTAPPVDRASPESTLPQ